MKALKKLAVLFAAGTLLTSSLTGCKVIEKAADEIVTSMVQWDLDSAFLNKHNDTYLTLTDITKEEAEEGYWAIIDLDVENFCYYWGIIDGEYVTVEDLDPKLQDRLVTLMDTISQKVKFEVQSASAMDDSSYSVKVVLSPIDIMEQASNQYDEETYEPLNKFWTESESLDFEAMSDEEYIDYCNQYGTIITQMVEELLPNLGYLEEESMLIQVESVDDVWETNESDIMNFYDKIIFYPYE